MLVSIVVGLGTGIGQAQPPKVIAALVPEGTVLPVSKETVSPVSKETTLPVKESSSLQKTPLTMEEGLAKKISLDLRGMDIVDTIKFLSMKGDLNIVTSKNVTGRVTLFLEGVTIADTLDVILLTNKLACEKKKNIITIMTEVEYEAFYGQRYTDKRKIKTLKLKYILPTKAGEALASVQSSIGKIIMDDATGSLILIDTPEKIEEMEAIAFDLDKSYVTKVASTVIKVFELRYAQAEEIAAKVSEALTEGLGSVRSDERTNKLIVRDLPNKIKEISEMIDAFDTREKEVFIEAKIVEVTLSDDFSFGVNWETLFNSGSKDVRLETTLPAAGVTDAYSRVSVGTWKDTALDSTRTQQILTFLSEVGKVKIVSSPHITVLNNEEAKIMVGTRQPYATSTISQSDTTATTSWSAEFVDVGVTLTVTPTIYKGDFVKMHIKPEVSTLIDWFEIEDESGAAQIRLPEVDTSNAETDVIIQDGKTIIIAGLIKETENKSESKVPFLSSIPFLGKLFKSTSDTNEMKELVVFITPHIISGDKNILYAEQTEKTRKASKRHKEERKRRKPPKRKIQAEAL